MLPKTEKSSSQDPSASSLIRKMLGREMSAIRTYAAALERIRDVVLAPVLGRILEDHRTSLRLLTSWLPDASDRESALAQESTLAAPSAAGASESMRNPPADRMILDGLLREESLGERLYRGGLGSGELSDPFRFFLGSRLLPERQRNRALLEVAAASTSAVPKDAAMSAG